MAVFHLNLTKEQLQGATIALMPGDPGRVPHIASYLESSVQLANNREYNTYLGYLKGTPIVVCSHGIGGPSTSIAVEELAQLGIKTFIRIGTSGAIQPHINLGDMCISSGAVRLDGASYHFAPAAYPAVASHRIVNALVAGAEKNNNPYHVGINLSSDTFYPGQERYDTYTGYVRKELVGAIEDYRNLNVNNIEMEAATLFVMASTMGLEAGMVAGIIVNRTKGETPNEEFAKKLEANTIKTAISAVEYLLVN